MLNIKFSHREAEDPQEPVQTWLDVKRIDGISDFAEFGEIHTCPFVFLSFCFQLLQDGILRALPKSARLHTRLARKAEGMTCRVVRLVERDHLVLLHISGHLQQVHVSMIEDLIAQETDPVILDLEKVTLIDREMVRFFAACNARSIELRNCPAFIREWMSKM